MAAETTRIADNTPIIVGAGQHVEQLAAGAKPPFSAPMQLAAMASRAALADAGAQPADIDTIAVIRLFSDAARAWACPFGGSNNPPESVARHLGATPDRRIYSSAGGTEPLQIMVELLGAIARGESRMALLTGAEAIASQRYALRNGFEDDWSEEYDAPLDNREYNKRFASKAELRSGMLLPVHYYALVENRQAHSLGHDLDQHRRYMGAMMAPFSAVAADNPYAQHGRFYAAEELATVNGANYPISLPLSKLLVAQDAVNQAAALVLTSAGYARELGIDPAHWIFLDGYAAGEDRYLAQRVDPGRSTAMERVFDLALAGDDWRDMAHLDIYSCFPCAVHAACSALGAPTDGSRALTVTGGLPYFGGPGNNYSLHALAEMATRLRGSAHRALVTANGGILSKHAAAILSGCGERAATVDWRHWEAPSVDADTIEELPLCDQPREGRILTWTVIERRGESQLAVALCETDAGERFLASSEAQETTGALSVRSPIGARVNVEPGEKRHAFTLAAA